MPRRVTRSKRNRSSRKSNRSVRRSKNRSVRRNMKRSVRRSKNRSVRRSKNRSVRRSKNRSVRRNMKRSVRRRTNREIKRGTKRNVKNRTKRKFHGGGVRPPATGSTSAGVQSPTPAPDRSGPPPPLPPRLPLSPGMFERALQQSRRHTVRSSIAPPDSPGSSPSGVENVYAPWGIPRAAVAAETHRQREQDTAESALSVVVDRGVHAQSNDHSFLRDLTRLTNTTPTLHAHAARDELRHQVRENAAVPTAASKIQAVQRGWAFRKELAARRAQARRQTRRLLTGIDEEETD